MNTSRNSHGHIRAFLLGRYKVLFQCIFGLLTAFVCISGATAQSGSSGLPFIRNFTPVEYRAGIQNWYIAQDKRGVIFIANNYGLLEYDGSEWETYRVSNGSKMRSLAHDTDGRIYVGCQGDFGYFFPNEQGKLTYTSLADSLPNNYRNFDETWSVFIDEGRIYFCTFTRIYVYNNGAFTIIEASNPLELSFYVNRQLFVLVKNLGLTTLAGNELKLLPSGDFFAKSSVSSILPLSKDRLLISTFQDGLFEWDDHTLKEWNPSLQKTFKESIVNCMLLLHNGNLAVGTQNNGLFILSREGEVLMQLTNGKGLQNRTILSLYEDELGNLWIGQNNGIAYVELGSPFSHINEESGLPGTGYAAYLQQNKLYLGTNNGLYVKDVRQRMAPGKLVEGTRGQVYHIGSYGGELLIGHHTGAYRIEGERAVNLSEEPGAWIYASLPNTRQPLLIGGTYNGLQTFEKNNGKWRHKEKLSGFIESSRVMEFDKTNELWVTHGYKGAYKISIEGDSLRNVAYYGVDKGFPSNNLINVFNLRNELIFTTERGLYRYNEASDAFAPDPLFTKLLGAEAQIWVMKEDAFGNIYFVGRQHSGVLKRNTQGDYTLEANTFNRIQTFLNDDLENLHILSNNEVLFGAKEGFIHYAPEKDIRKAENFQTLLRRVSIVNGQGDSTIFYGNYTHNGKVVTQQASNESVELLYEQNALHFRFSATSYEGGEIQYQCYLENFEKDWPGWSHLTQKEYTNLKEGRYVFHVRARNIAGDISAQTTYTFYIHPPWYRSIWAIAAYIVFIVALLLSVFFFIDRKYQRAQHMMRLKQKKELIRKENEIEKMAQQSQEEISRLQNEKLESELMHINKELGTSTFHLLNKNEFISGIKNHLNSILKKEHGAEVQKELHKIVKDIEANISADADWEQFQIHFDRVHGDFSKRFKATHPSLSPQEIKLSAYLRMNLSTKEMAQLLHISVRGVEISRYRLRKKLQLERSINLQEYILGF